jgi:hypothetical protein
MNFSRSQIFPTTLMLYCLTLKNHTGTSAEAVWLWWVDCIWYNQPVINCKDRNYFWTLQIFCEENAKSDFKRITKGLRNENLTIKNHNSLRTPWWVLVATHQCAIKCEYLPLPGWNAMSHQNATGTCFIKRITAALLRFWKDFTESSLLFCRIGAATDCTDRTDFFTTTNCTN